MKPTLLVARSNTFVFQVSRYVAIGKDFSENIGCFVSECAAVDEGPLYWRLSEESESFIFIV